MFVFGTILNDENGLKAFQFGMELKINKAKKKNKFNIKAEKKENKQQ